MIFFKYNVILHLNLAREVEFSALNTLLSGDHRKIIIGTSVVEFLIIIQYCVDTHFTTSSLCVFYLSKNKCHFLQSIMAEEID